VYDHYCTATGLGGLGRTQLDAFTDLPGVEILAGADPVADARDSFARDFGARGYRSYEELLASHANELDAVNVATPHALHFEQAMAALDAGLSVHLEKPMVTDLGDALRLTEAAAHADATVQVGYQRHFDPRFRAMRETVQSGAIGEVVGANCFLEQNWIRPVSGTWRTDPSLSGGGQPLRLRIAPARRSAVDDRRAAPVRRRRRRGQRRGRRRPQFPLARARTRRSLGPGERVRHRRRADWPGHP